MVFINSLLAPMANRVVLILIGAFVTAHSHAQMADPGLPPVSATVTSAQPRALVLTGFAVNQPVQVLDIDDIAQGFPREVARRLIKNRQLQVRTSPNLLSVDWQQDAPTASLLSQVGVAYGSQFIVAGEIRNAGTKTDTNLFGLTQKKTRAIEVDIRIYDARSGQLIVAQDFSKVVAGDVAIGREHVFGGAAFTSTAYGKAINEVLDQVAELVSATIIAQR